MELWIWIGAALVSLVVIVLALAYLAAKSISLGKRVQPFIAHIAKFRKDIEQYPEALKFLTEQVAPKNPPAKGSEASND